MDIVNQNQGEKLEVPMIWPTAQGISDTLRKLDLTESPAEADHDNHADEDVNMPLPKPVYERRNKGALHTYSMQGMIKRVQSEPPRTHNSDFRREQLRGDNMAHSLPNLHCSRASHNRSLGLGFLDSRGSHDQANTRERVASRVAEFTLIMDDL